ncbi:MAG: S-methyl-5-thioribose-1-phosphate isomerase [Candidatus Peribacteraceae bacterium]|nr:S-methyl-5-thioribose-1-phosphate isomerase [Candidatus Peribacteraceae bacterium]
MWFEKDKIKMINQLVLPHKFEITELKNVSDVALAITSMVVRGAPAIGATGAYGMVLAILKGDNPEKAAEVLRGTRPTAQDLFHGIDYVLESVKNTDDSQLKHAALKAAEDYANWSVEACKSIGEHGSQVIKDGNIIATHCNAGWLATVDWGTALSPIYAAKRQDKKIEVYVDETRPRLQGANLTSWELLNEGIPHYIITDNATGYYMSKREIDLMIVGADRVARNGDFANKIGTYEKAVVAKENGIPFYVAIPSTTIDVLTENGSKIPIEERDENEVHFIGKERITPRGARAKNPAFDVTPAKFVTGIITERGIFRPEELSKVFSKK